MFISKTSDVQVCHPPTAKRRRLVANLTQRKNPYTPVYGIFVEMCKDLTICAFNSPKWLTPSFFNMHMWRHQGRAKMLYMLTKMIHKYTTDRQTDWKETDWKTNRHTKWNSKQS